MSRVHDRATLRKEHVPLLARLGRVMALVAVRLLRPLGCTVLVLDYQSARWLKTIAGNLHPYGASGEPWDEDVMRFAGELAKTMQSEQGAHPTHWSVDR